MDHHQNLHQQGRYNVVTTSHHLPPIGDQGHTQGQHHTINSNKIHPVMFDKTNNLAQIQIISHHNNNNNQLMYQDENVHRSSPLIDKGSTSQLIQMGGSAGGLDKTAGDEDDEDEGEAREQWGSKVEFLLACLGYAVGLGNVWRFPYLAYKNGGGAFVIPYIIMVFVVGLPLFLLEMTLAQYSSLGPAHLYNHLCPIFKTVGLASIVASAVVGIYYNMIIAWTLFYTFESFFGTRWSECDQWWNTENCTVLSANGTSLNHTAAQVPSAEEFYNNYVLVKSEGIHDMGGVQWKLLVSLLAAWVIVCLSLIKGIQTSGKVVYFTATFPYVILVVLFFRGITLDGAWEGIKFYVYPDFTKITEIRVWRDAAVQVFYSFGIGGGGMATYSSYNRFRDPVVRHALFVGLGDMLTSLFAGFVIFSMVGFVAHTLDRPVSEVVSSGTGLAFIVIPGGLTQMPLSVFWCFLFFFMLFLLGIDSQFAIVESATTMVFDTYRKNKPGQELNKPLIVTLMCVVWFLAGIPLCTRGGIYLLDLMDYFSAGIPYLLIGLLNTLIVVYFYGIKNFLDDLNLMAGWQPHVLTRSHLIVLLSTLCPLIITYLLAGDVYHLFSEDFSVGTYTYPGWAHAIGHFFALFPVAIILAGMLHYMVTSKKGDGSVWGRFKAGFRPTAHYGDHARKELAREAREEAKQARLQKGSAPPLPAGQVIINQATVKDLRRRSIKTAGIGNYEGSEM